ncbi:hypothetical protein QBC44DRAFT_115691 [Cladorrhinum sp. PSN332]|nr:hypothetical protein QBC44DRAFT_115691 [Cladorrhinum sp. PSN332]
MQLTTLFSSLLLMGGLAAAAPVAEGAVEQCDEQIICIDAINACGVKYGGCYDICKASAKPQPPPCPATSTKKPTSTAKITRTVKPTSTVKPTTTKKTTTKKTTTSTKRTLSTSTVKPTTTKKPTSTKRTITSTPKPTTWKPSTSASSSSTCNGSGMTVCWDAINACGQMYGACFPDCKPWPTPSAPPCLVPTSAPVPTLIKTTDLPILTVGRG